MISGESKWITVSTDQHGLHILALSCPWCYGAVELGGSVASLQRVCPHCMRIFHLQVISYRHYPKRHDVHLDPRGLLEMLRFSSTRRVAKELGVSHNTVARWAREARKAVAQEAELPPKETPTGPNPASDGGEPASGQPEPHGAVLRVFGDCAYGSTSDQQAEADDAE